MKNDRTFAVGKLKHDLLAKMLKDFVSDLDMKDQRVIMGSKIGEDAAVIDMDDKYLVAKTDPITFATDEIGYYAVNVNVNDVVCTGAKPKWFQSTILLPEGKTSEELVENIFKSIHDTCKSMGIAVIGGHTEVSVGLDRPIVVGSLLGEVDKDKLVNTSGAEVGDALILTKGIFIEGTSIIGREKEKDLIEKGFDSKFIETCKNYLYKPGISVFEEALLSNQHFKISSMHDPTEGGLSCGIAEMAIASETGMIINMDAIPVLQEPLKLSKIYGLDPMSTISSGSLLISLNDEDSKELIELLDKNKVCASLIGSVVSKDKGLFLKQEDGTMNPLNYSETDEITKIF